MLEQLLILCIYPFVLNSMEEDGRTKFTLTKCLMKSKQQNLSAKFHTLQL